MFSLTRLYFILPANNIGSYIELVSYIGIIVSEIDGCLLNDTCWFNPQTQMSDCTDIPGSQLRPWNTGYEIVCGACPHGMTGSGDTAGGQSGCTGLCRLSPILHSYPTISYCMTVQFIVVSNIYPMFVTLRRHYDIQQQDPYFTDQLYKYEAVRSLHRSHTPITHIPANFITIIVSVPSIWY